MEIIYAAIEQGQLVTSQTPSGHILAVHLKGTIQLNHLLPIIKTPLLFADADSGFDLSQIELFAQQREGIGGLTELVVRVGRANALELLLNKQVINAARAEQLGLINEVLSLSAFQQRMTKMAQLSLSAIELAIDVSRRGQRLSHAQAEKLERYAFTLRFTHPDQQEGMSAFLEKRLPKFTG